ncbi:MAG TPA: endonuclease domain-containing protein [Planctomycetaceae bacterium]|nr:endonuclease domain-containing protein [Planctomycetaceae bacterium]
MTQHFNKTDHKPVRQEARASMPRAEVLLWSKLKGRQLLNCKFRRQYGIESYRLDFYSSELKLGIELDGETHYIRDADSYDARRDRFIESLGIRVLRILNSDVYENLEGVWEAIARAAREQMARIGPDVTRGRRTRRGEG